MKHGHAGANKSVEYRTWERMHNRCKSDKDAAHYRDKGIKVCERWKSFEAFLEDMGPRPPDKTSIDRKKSDVGYEPGNCVWATTQEQNWNKSDTRLITINGVTRPLFVWPKFLGIKRGTVSGRISLGWSPLEALLTPVGQPRPPRQLSLFSAEDQGTSVL